MSRRVDLNIEVLTVERFDLADPVAIAEEIRIATAALLANRGQVLQRLNRRAAQAVENDDVVAARGPHLRDVGEALGAVIVRSLKP